MTEQQLQHKFAELEKTGSPEKPPELLGLESMADVLGLCTKRIADLGLILGLVRGHLMNEAATPEERCNAALAALAMESDL